MKHVAAVLFTFLFFKQSIHAQIFIGAKASYDRYFSPEDNGATFNLFLEYPFGPHNAFSVRGGLFTGTPINTTEHAVSFPSNDIEGPDFQDQTEQIGDLRTTINYAGIFGEIMYFFRGDAQQSNFYSIARIGLSYTYMNKRMEGINESLVVRNIKFQDDDQFSVYAGLGAGYQLALGKEKRCILFSEITFGVPFLVLEEGEIFYYGNTFPLFSVSGNIGFKYFIRPSN